MTAATVPDPRPRGDERAVAAYLAERLRAVPGDVGRPVPDELAAGDGTVRTEYRDLAASLDLLGPAGLLTRRERARRFVEDDGVTYGVPVYPGSTGAAGDSDEWEGSAAAAPARWALDPLPLVIGAVEWAALSRGLLQRAELLDAILADLYGRRVLLHEGVIPPELVLAHPEFIRAADQVRLPARQLFTTATDLARDPGGQWVVLGDRTQAPSGAGYAMANRRIVSRVLPGLYRHTGLAQLRPFFDAVRAGLADVAPAHAESPRVVLLSPGPASETAFDQAFLATILGYPLLEGGDLTVREGRVWMRSVGRLEPVDVVLRRIDSWFCDPLELRPDSRLGVPGLTGAARRRTVSIVNPLGAGVLENPGLLPFLPAAGRLLLGAEPALPSVPTYWCGDELARRHVLQSLASLVVKPVGRGSGRHSAFGWELSAQARDDMRRRIEAAPGQWCAQEPLDMSTAPVVGDSGLEARHLVLRTFAVSQAGGYRLMSGGLARVSGRAGSRFVSSADGALAKDVWILAGDEAGPFPASVSGEAPETVAAPAVIPALAPRVAEDLFWLGRYAERAEGTARLLRVVDDLAADYARRTEGPGVTALRVMLAATTHVTATYPGFLGADEDGGPVAPQADLVRLVVDRSRPGTVGYAVRRTIEAAHAVREQLSRDTWVVLGALERVLDDLAERAAGALPGDEPPLQPALARLLEGLLAISGLAAESMVRDTGWHFMQLGKRLERALQVVALVRHGLEREHGTAVDALVIESVLMAAESSITFRRRHAAGWAPMATDGRAAGAATHLAGVLDLLVADETNPRALACQLDGVAVDLRHLRSPDGGAHLDEALRAVQARVRETDPVALAHPTAGGHHSDLVGLLDALAAELARLAVDVEAAYFAHAAPLRPLPPPTPGWQA